MERKENIQTIDAGRLAAVPVFSFFLFVCIYGFCDQSDSLFPLTGRKVLTLIHQLLIFSFYGLEVLFYFIRSRPKTSSHSVLARGIALLAVFYPFVFLLLGQRHSGEFIRILMAGLVMMSGIAFSIFALATLGRSFSIIPQTKKLIQRGPYLWVRHPLYLGEMVSVAGIILLEITPMKLVAFSILIALQVYGAREEETLLSAEFPQYEVYRRKTASFIPGLV